LSLQHAFKHSKATSLGTDLISKEVESAARSGDAHNFILQKLRSHSAVDTGIILAAVSADLLCIFT